MQENASSGIQRLVVVMADEGAVKRLCRLPFSPQEVAFVWDALLWKAWVGDVGGPRSLAVSYLHTLFAFMSVRQRHRQAAAAMWALYYRVTHAPAGGGGGGGDAARLAVSALSCAISSLALVPREQAYLLGRDWWPRCPDPLSIVTIDDMRAELLR
jgi:hypothetical protein